MAAPEGHSEIGVREAYRKYEEGELSQEAAVEIIGEENWDAVVTGARMEEDAEAVDWDSRYDDEDPF